MRVDGGRNEKEATTNCKAGACQKYALQVHNERPTHSHANHHTHTTTRTPTDAAAIPPSLPLLLSTSTTHTCTPPASSCPARH